MLETSFLINLLGKANLDDIELVEVAVPDIDLVRLKAVGVSFDFVKAQLLSKKWYRDCVVNQGPEITTFIIKDLWEGNRIKYYLKVERGDGTGTLFSLVTKEIRFVNSEGSEIVFSSFTMLNSYLEKNTIE